MTTRTQLCTICSVNLDNHTNEDFLACEVEAQTEREGIWREQRLTHIAPQPKIDQSWEYTLPERYQG